MAKKSKYTQQKQASGDASFGKALIAGGGLVGFALVLLISMGAGHAADMALMYAAIACLLCGGVMKFLADYIEAEAARIQMQQRKEAFERELAEQLEAEQEMMAEEAGGSVDVPEGERE